MYYTTQYPSPVGLLTLASDGDNLLGLWKEGQKYFGGTLSAHVTPKHGIALFAAIKAWLDSYFAGERPAITALPLAPVGSAFRQRVWSMLCEIPYGELTTYGALAQKMATLMQKHHMSSQAVGGAVGHNPISIIIPCHRVVGTNGSLTGYAGGISTKVRLLELEGIDMSKLPRPQKGTAL